MIPPLAIAYYGDDFTGSTDVMEVLTWAGLPTVLFLDVPSAAQLARFPDARGVGVAGDSRSRGPAWMDEHLPPIFERLRSLGAGLYHYKVCSTFDSSPGTGSIGRALEIGLRVFGGDWASIIVGAPQLARYQAFGNLFATVGAQTHRLDRYPTMSRHPVTPMAEADLRRHLAAQTELPVGLVDLLSFNDQALDREASNRAVLFDVLDRRTQAAAGRLVWQRRAAAPFSVSSSGLEYALVAHWGETGELPAEAAAASATETDRVVVVSGSCSPETAASIRWAAENGFEAVRLDAAATAEGRIDAPLAAAREALAAGRSVVLYSAEGPDDEGFVRAAGEFQQALGRHSGRLLRRILEETGVGRAVVCGGDTSSHAVSELGLFALTAVAPATPGAPLCRAWSDGPLDGLEIVLKGGQRGGPGFFEQVRRARPDR